MSVYSVALWSTPMPWPLSFAVHVWFVVTCDEVSDRYEVWAKLGKINGTAVVKNALDLQSGFRTSYFSHPVTPKKTGVATLLARVEGEAGSVVAELYQRIVSSPQMYPHTTRYRMWPGPNSNTYVAWCVAPCPDLQVALPWNAFGKNFPTVY
jgi:hypothetical protein